MKDKKRMKGSSAFVLYQGIQMWDRVAEILTSLGHTVYTPQLPGTYTDTADIRRETADSSAHQLAKVIEELPGKVILVGCSRGGVWNTLIGELIPDKIEKIVYDSAWLLLPGESGNGLDGSGRHPKYWYQCSDDGGVTMKMTAAPDPAPLHPYLMSLADVIHMFQYMERDMIDILYKKVYPTPYRWGTIRRFSINNTLDLDIAYEFLKLQCELIENEAVYEIESDHCSMMSTPEEMAYVLHEIARR